MASLWRSCPHFPTAAGLLRASIASLPSFMPPKCHHPSLLLQCWAFSTQARTLLCHLNSFFHSPVTGTLRPPTVEIFPQGVGNHSALEEQRRLGAKSQTRRGRRGKRMPPPLSETLPRPTAVACAAPGLQGPFKQQGPKLCTYTLTTALGLAQDWPEHGGSVSDAQASGARPHQQP